MLAAARPAPETYPVTSTATAPEWAVQPEAPPLGPQLHAVNENRPATQRAYQQSLFPHGPNERVVEFESMVEPGRPGRPGRNMAKRKRPSPPGQTSFDFSPPPPPRRGLGLLREMDSSKAPLPVAPLAIRAVSAVVDCLVVLAFTGVFLLTLHAMSLYVVHESIFVRTALPYLAASPLIFGFLYKLLFALSGGTTVGIRLMGLSLVSLDGQRPNPAQRIIRMLGGWLSLLAATIGLLWALTDQETLTWHDHMSGTFLTPAMP